MLVEQVSQLPPLERFLYWIGERHQIYLRRQAGQPKPWTDDTVLQSYFFTNPYRENDKVTIWFRDNIRDPLAESPAVVFATICFRWFNTIPTGKLIKMFRLQVDWDKATAREVLTTASRKGPVFTFAYMIPAPPKSKKIDHVCECLDTIWKDRHNLYRDLTKGPYTLLRHAWMRILEYPWLGKFMSYEVVTDLRHTHILRSAPDILTWANPGPGCIRGLYRLAGLPLSSRGNSDCMKAPDDWQYRMQTLLAQVSARYPDYPTFEMREIEHSLCEWDKYERGRLNDGKMKRKYPGV